MYKNIIERTTLSYIINLLQLDTECMDGNEQDYCLMQKDLLADTEKYLHKKVSEEELKIIMDNFNDYGTARAGEALQLGMKAGIKLMKELNQL